MIFVSPIPIMEYKLVHSWKLNIHKIYSDLFKEFSGNISCILDKWINILKNISFKAKICFTNENKKKSGKAINQTTIKRIQVYLICSMLLNSF